MRCKPSKLQSRKNRYCRPALSPQWHTEGVDSLGYIKVTCVSTYELTPRSYTCHLKVTQVSAWELVTISFSRLLSGGGTGKGRRHLAQVRPTEIP